MGRTRDLKIYSNKLDSWNHDLFHKIKGLNSYQVQIAQTFFIKIQQTILNLGMSHGQFSFTNKIIQLEYLISQFNQAIIVKGKSKTS